MSNNNNMSGGATIADRFKLNAPPPPKPASAAGGPATMIAFGAGVLALIVAGALVFTLWQHWQSLLTA